MASVNVAPAVPDGAIFAEWRCWTTIAADHEDEDGHTIIDGDKVGEREEEFVLYFGTRELADAWAESVRDAWDEVPVGTCASLRFGNVFVARARRPAIEWFAASEWDSRRPELGWLPWGIT